MDTTKKCSKCGNTKPADQFTKRPERPVGLYSCCKQCKAKSRKDSYSYRRKNDDVAFWALRAKNQAKDRTNRTGLPTCTITVHDILKALETSGSKCTYCGIAVNFHRTVKDRFDAPSIDRILPSGGYTPENIVVACYRCNAIKSDASPDELMQIASIASRLAKERRLPQT